MKFYTDKPVTPQSIALWFVVCLLAVFLCTVGIMWFDLYSSRQKFILEMAKTASRPSIVVTHSDYLHITQSEIIVSGVTEVEK